ncbi:MAG TPA: hypothetical protein VFT72_19730 [Opitutaceae bacterium]|nr:hypothetical protein [Opitutaceae bacterium]
MQLLQAYKANKAHFWRGAVIVVLLLAGFAALSQWLDVDEIRNYTEHLDGTLLFVLITALPLAGFPITPLHVVAGIRWGAALGLGLVAISILLQVLASFALVKLFRPLFAKKLAKFREKIPRGAYAPVTLFIVLVPGVPYFAKNYLIPFAGVPLHIFLLVAFPIHALRASIAVIFGQESDNLTPGRIAIFAVYWITVTLGCAWAFRRLRKQVGGPRPAANDPTPRA